MIEVNQPAPDFTLPSLANGQIHFYGTEAKTAFLVFYKYNCGSCRLALPFLQKIYNAYGDAFFFTTIAQDGAKTTAGFMQEMSITMPVLLDLPPYLVSNAYGIHTVPSIFLVDTSRVIRFAGFGFVKKEILDLSDILAEKSGRPQIDVFGNAAVPELKPG